MNKRAALFISSVFLLSIIMISAGINASSYSPDTIPPVITLNGNSIVNIALGSQYIDAGANAIDNRDGNITVHMLTVNAVDTSALGTYYVLYTSTDSSGNIAKANRTVNVLPANEIQNSSNGSLFSPNVMTNDTILSNTSNPFTSSAPLTGGVTSPLSSAGGIIGIVAFAVVLVIAIIIVRARKKYKKNFPVVEEK